MRSHKLPLAALVLALFLAPVFARNARAGNQEYLAKLVADAVSEDSAVADPAIHTLRTMGPAGLEKFIELHQAEIDAAHNSPSTSKNDPNWLRIKAALDQISGQRDCHASKLYWYTDFDAAKAAAKQSGKPILSLRMLGNLTDEFSCANSRFFRSTLYSNDEISQLLRDKFILHWKSVRPVPKVTIDFGDGRKLERTLTGNSIHYVLDSDGNVIDAIPGLYGPQAFLRILKEDEDVVADLHSPDMNAERRSTYLTAYHEAWGQKILGQWQDDLEQLGLYTPPPTPAPPAAQTNSQPNSAAVQVPAEDARASIFFCATTLEKSFALSKPRSVAANRIGFTKAAAETPLLAGALADPNVLISTTDDAAWGRIAVLHKIDAQLDPASVAYINTLNPTAGQAGRVAMTKAPSRKPNAPPGARLREHHCHRHGSQ